MPVPFPDEIQHNNPNLPVVKTSNVGASTSDTRTTSRITGKVFDGFFDQFTGAAIQAFETNEITSDAKVDNMAYFKSGSKYYRRSDAIITPEMFGAVGNGTTDDYTAFSMMLAASATLKKRILLDKKKRYAVSQTIVIDVNNVSIDFNGAYIIPLMTTGVVVKVFNGGTTSASSSSFIQNKVSTLISGLAIFSGSSTPVTGITALQIGDDKYYTSMLVFSQLYIQGFDIGVTHTKNVWCIRFQGFGLNYCNKCYYSPLLANSGENMLFIGGTFANSTNCVWNENDGSSIFVQNCSLDYCAQYVKNFTGTVRVYSCYLENGGDIYLDKNILFDIQGGAFIMANSGLFILKGNDIVNYPIFNNAIVGGEEYNINLVNNRFLSNPIYKRDSLIEGSGKNITTGTSLFRGFIGSLLSLETEISSTNFRDFTLNHAIASLWGSQSLILNINSTGSESGGISLEFSAPNLSVSPILATKSFAVERGDIVAYNFKILANSNVDARICFAKNNVPNTSIDTTSSLAIDSTVTTWQTVKGALTVPAGIKYAYIYFVPSVAASVIAISDFNFQIIR